MYKELKVKIEKLISKDIKSTKYNELLLCFNSKLKKLETKEDIASKEEVEVVKRIIQRIERKIQKTR